VSEHEKHKKLRCFFQDEDVREKIDTYLRENKFEVCIHILTKYINEEVLLYLRENKFEVRIHTLTKYINREVLPNLDDGLFVKLSERTVIQWMKIFGHSY